MAGRKIQSQAIAVLVVFMVGCEGQSSDPERVPVFTTLGRVTVNGQPVAGANVRFHPADVEQAKVGLFPQATTDADGNFKLSTYGQMDGGPAGDYKVTVTWPDVDFKPQTGEQREALLEGGEKPDKFRGKYANPETSRLKATILSEDDQELSPIESK